MKAVQGVLTATVGLAAIFLTAGCPGIQDPVEFIAGQTGDPVLLAGQASVEVFSPLSDLAIPGGTPVEVNWRAVATTAYAVVDVFLDFNVEPENGNEIVVLNNLALSETTALIDTTRLEAGEYLVGVRVEEVGKVVAFDYAGGRLVINQAPDLFFTSPRNNFRFDRAARINPTFDVAWSLHDPDSIVSVQVFLDPDELPNGNEVLLRTSNSQTGDSFSFDLPTASFEFGTYRLLALVSDGVDTFSFYAPGGIVLRSRLAGPIDLRDMHLPETGISGAVFEGFNPRDNAGSLVASAQDIDSDGFDDLFILAQFGKPDYIVNRQRTGVGEGYLVYGRTQRFSGVLNLNSTGTLFRGEIYGGVPEVADPIRPSRGITSFAVLTDWDGDGVRELAFGIPFTDSLPSGFLEGAGYFRSGAVVIAASSSLGNFAGQNVYRLGDFGTVPVPNFEFPDTIDCLEGFTAPNAPSPFLIGGSFGATLFYENYSTQVTATALGAHISTAEFGDQCGETISPYPFYGGFT